MAGVPQGQMVVSCACGAKLRVPAAAVGKKTKCPKCGSLLVIKAPAPPPPPVPPAESGGGLLDDLAAFEQSATASAAPQPATGGKGPACPNCGLALPPSARLCIACGFDLAAGQVRQMAKGGTAAKPSKTAELAKSAGTFLLGSVLSLVGALIGGAVWVIVAWYLKLEVGYIAWGVGVLAGLGMVIGHHNPTSRSGMMAALMAVVGIVAAKATIFIVVLVSVVTGDTNDIEFQRAYVTAHIANDKLNERGVKDPAQRQAQWQKTFKEAEAEVKRMSDQEVRQKWQAFREEGDSDDLEDAKQDEDSSSETTATSQGGGQEKAPDPGTAQGPEREAGPGILYLFLRYGFGIFDVLWFILAVGSAYRIGSNGLSLGGAD